MQNCVISQKCMFSTCSNPSTNSIFVVTPLVLTPLIGGTQTGSYQTGSYQKGRFIPPKPKILYFCFLIRPRLYASELIRSQGDLTQVHPTDDQQTWYIDTHLYIMYTHAYTWCVYIADTCITDYVYNICICICIYIYIYIYSRWPTQTDLMTSYFRLHRYDSTYICMYVCMYVCIYVCMYVCMYVYIYMHICIYVCVCIYTYIYIYIYMHISLSLYIYIYICIHLYGSCQRDHKQRWKHWDPLSPWTRPTDARLADIYIYICTYA